MDSHGRCRPPATSKYSDFAQSSVWWQSLEDKVKSLKGWRAEVIYSTGLRQPGRNLVRAVTHLLEQYNVRQIYIYLFLQLF
jgi:hypothetical protein